MKPCFFIMIAILGIAVARADQEKKEVLLSSADTLVRLEKVRAEVFSTPPTYESLKRYETELQKSAEEFIALANRAQKIDPALGKKTYECGMALVDSAFAIFKGFEAKAPPEKIVDVHARRLAKIPAAYAQFLAGFGALKGDGAVLSRDEQVEVGSALDRRLKELPEAPTPRSLVDAIRELVVAVAADEKKA